MAGKSPKQIVAMVQLDFNCYFFPSDAAAGQVVATVSAVDRDVTAPNNDLVYVITSGAGSNFELTSPASGKKIHSKI